MKYPKLGNPVPVHDLDDVSEYSTSTRDVELEPVVDGIICDKV